MSQTLKINTAGVIPNSTTVKAYLPGQVPDKRRAPIGVKVAEAETSGGELTLTALPDNAVLYLAYELESKWIYPMEVTTPNISDRGMSEVASAETMTLPNGRLIKVTGSTEVKKITATTAGDFRILLMTATAKLIAGENLKISAAGPNTADDTITLVCDGTNWYEVGRSTNP